MTKRRNPAFIAAFLVTATVSCGGETSVLLQINGSYPSATKLTVRMVGDQGPLPMTFTFPETGPLNVPGSVLIKTNPGHIGVFMWAEDAMGRPVAQARSFACMAVSSGVQSKYSITLEPVTGTFSPNDVNGCGCDRTTPTVADMCPPGGRPPLGGAGGGSVTPLGGSGGSLFGGSSGASDGGVAGASGTGGSSAVDGGAGTTGGSGGGSVDAAPVMPGNSNEVWGFEVAGWSANPAVAGVTVAQDADAKQGTKSLAVTGPATDSNVKVVSPPFMDPGTPTAKIGIWVWLNPPAEFYTYIEVRAQCGGQDVYFGGQSLQMLPKMTWTRLTFPVPNYAPAALKGTCTLSVGLQGLRGTVKLDGVAFDP